jgi:hypothetical protein
MRFVILSATLLVATLLDACGRAPAAPICYEFEGFEDCSYYNFEQCRATANGNGGRCYDNPRLPAAEIHGRPGRPARQ